MALYLIIVNVLAFFLMGHDKRRARAGQWRISERTLFLVAICGGALGAWIGMYTFRHKTRKRAFVLGMPLLVVVTTLLVLKAEGISFSL